MPGHTMNPCAQAVVGVLLAVSAMVGSALADSHASNQLVFTKGKFSVPIDPDAVKADWTARGYSNPKVNYYAPGWSKGEHTHPVHIIVTMIVGRMEFIIAGQRFVVEPGDELLYPAHAVHSARNLHDGASHMLESSRW